MCNPVSMEGRYESECPSRTLFRPWEIKSERLFSPKGTLKMESREAEIGTLRTFKHTKL